jgi:hypothetical protein
MSLENNLITELERTNFNINNIYNLYLKELKNKQTPAPTYSSKLVAFITREIKKYFTSSEQLERELEQESTEQLRKEWKVAAGGPPPPPPPPPGGMGVQNEDKKNEDKKNEDKKKLLQLILKIRDHDYDIYNDTKQNIIAEYFKMKEPKYNFRKKYLKYKQKYLELKNIFQSR